MDSPPPPPVIADTASFTEHQYRGPEGSRPYRLFIPGGGPQGAPLPLIVMLHGCTQDAADLARGTRLNALAAERRFMVLYPEQPASFNPLKCWNWFLPEHQGRGQGEPAIIAGMTREVMAGHRIDPARVYIAGISAGGAMAVLTSLGYPDLYAAAAVHSGIQYRAAGTPAEVVAVMKSGGPDPGGQARLAQQAMDGRARMVPVIIVQGAKDPSVLPGNAQALTAQFAAVARLNGTPIGSAPDRNEVIEQGAYRVQRSLYNDANRQPVIEVWLIEGLAHAWSGGSAEGTWTDPAAPDITPEIVRFLLAHPMPTAPTRP
jgi:poly(hydroxyalkanoate) depolymerase family esterase